MSTLRLTTISNQDGSATVPSQTVISGSAKAWVNFNGTGTVAIRASFNVSSITDNATGDYTINFATALVDANYSAQQSAGDGTAAGGRFTFGYWTTPPTTTTYRLIVTTFGGSSHDPVYVTAVINR
jgi:hypothetical protein